MGESPPWPVPVLCVGKKISAAFFGREPSCGPTVSISRASLFVGVKIHVDHCLREHSTGLECSFLVLVWFGLVFGEKFKRGSRAVLPDRMFQMMAVFSVFGGQCDNH